MAGMRAGVPYRRALGHRERDPIRERTRAGLAAAAARGRRAVVTEDKSPQGRDLLGKA
jgi:DNA invertase Pin-like site-specific DNA recombinase